MLSKDTKGEELAEADRNHSTHENKKGQTKWPYNKAHATKEKEVEWPDALQNKWGWARQAKTEKQWHGQTIKTQASDQTRQTQSNNTIQIIHTPAPTYIPCRSWFMSKRVQMKFVRFLFTVSTVRSCALLWYARNNFYYT